MRGDFGKLVEPYQKDKFYFRGVIDHIRTHFSYIVHIFLSTKYQINLLKMIELKRISRNFSHVSHENCAQTD